MEWPNVKAACNCSIYRSKSQLIRLKSDEDIGIETDLNMEALSALPAAAPVLSRWPNGLTSIHILYVAPTERDAAASTPLTRATTRGYAENIGVLRPRDGV